MIIIAPWAQKLRGDKQELPNPKNYPFWKEVVAGIKEPIIQIGVEGEEQLVPDIRKSLPLKELAKLVKECRTWIAVDSFFQHFAWLECKKRGIVLWGQSKPKIFGHPGNVNLLKNEKYLREKQFWLWEQCEFNAAAFVEPKVVLEALSKFS
jgi:ADP-heptose:LPS heptosyltransferase